MANFSVYKCFKFQNILFTLLTKKKISLPDETYRFQILQKADKRVFQWLFRNNNETHFNHRTQVRKVFRTQRFVVYFRLKTTTIPSDPPQRPLTVPNNLFPRRLLWLFRLFSIIALSFSFRYVFDATSSQTITNHD